MATSKKTTKKAATPKSKKLFFGFSMDGYGGNYSFDDWNLGESLDQVQGYDYYVEFTLPAGVGVGKNPKFVGHITLE